MINLISILIGSKIGRYVVVAGIFIVLVSLVLWRVFKSGQNKAKLEQQLRTLEALKTKVQLDAQIRKLSPDDRRKRLSKWMLKVN